MLGMRERPARVFKSHATQSVGDRPYSRVLRTRWSRNDFDNQDSAATVWLMRVGLPAAFFALLWFALRKKPDRALREKLKEVSPDRDDVCALCRGTLVLDHVWRCSLCGAEKAELGPT